MYGLSLLMAMTIALGPSLESQPQSQNPCLKENPTECEVMLLDLYIQEVGEHAKTKVKLDTKERQLEIAIDFLARRPVVEKVERTGWEWYEVLGVGVLCVGVGTAVGYGLSR